MLAVGSASRDEPSAAYAVTGEQVRQWAFLGCCALIDIDKYLRRDSLWEARGRLHEARHHIWALWAAAHSTGILSAISASPPGGTRPTSPGDGRLRDPRTLP